MTDAPPTPPPFGSTQNTAMDVGARHDGTIEVRVFGLLEIESRNIAYYLYSYPLHTVPYRDVLDNQVPPGYTKIRSAPDPEGVNEETVKALFGADPSPEWYRVLQWFQQSRSSHP